MSDIGLERHNIDMTRVAELVTEAGVPAYVQMTGGGVATIYAGNPYENDDFEMIYPAVAGPGTYRLPPEHSMGSLYDFAVAKDDQGEGEYWSPMEIGAHTEGDIAKLIVATAMSPKPLDGAAIDSLGFDSEGHSTPPDADWEQQRTRVGIDAHNAVVRAFHEVARLSGQPYDGEAARSHGEAASARAMHEWAKDNPKPLAAGVDVWIVDQSGATYVFWEKEPAEQFLVAEAWNGAVHLTIAHDTIPTDKATKSLAGGPDDAAVEYVLSHCKYGDRGCDQ